MEKIIEPIDLALLKKELTPEKKLRNTNKANNEIYIVTAHDSPNVMLEIGRIREEVFRNAGGGTGLSVDIDEFDTMSNPCKQLVLWDPDAEAIIGGYRYILGPDIKLDKNGQPILAMSHLFKFSDKFINEYLPYTIELGRSFVSIPYQSSKAGAKALFALDNLWDGLAALMIQRKDMRYYFGKMTMYPSFDRYSRDLILYFLHKHFPDTENLACPHQSIQTETSAKLMDKILTDKDFKKDYKNLNQEVRKRGINIPPLVNSYMSISKSMKVFGTAINDEFGDVEETGIIVDFNDIYDEKRARHVDSFLYEFTQRLKLRFPQLYERYEGEIAERIMKRRDRIQARLF